MILSLETSTQVCSIALHDTGRLVASQYYNVDKSHSGLLPSIADQLLTNVGVDKSQLTAIAISSGPGSYTGLRIGLSTAKGLSYGLQIPLIAIPTLDILVAQASEFGAGQWIMPMLDARRMEVYTKIVDPHGAILEEDHPLIIDADSLSHYEGKQFLILGNAVLKAREVWSGNELLRFVECSPDARFMGKLAQSKYDKNDFEDIAYFEPDYLKEFQTKAPKNQLSS